MHLYVGTSGYSYKEWKGTFYPERLPDKQMLPYYAERFRTVFVSTADWGYLRLRRPDYGDAELQTWAKRVQDQDWREAFVFFKHEDEGKGPQMAKRFLELAG